MQAFPVFCMVLSVKEQSDLSKIIMFIACLFIVKPDIVEKNFVHNER